MDDLFGKLTSYQVFSSIVPGSLLLMAIVWAKGVDIKSFNGLFLAVSAYFLGLAANRFGAMTTYKYLGFTENQIKKLFILYEKRPISQSVFDTFSMYRTLVVVLVIISLLIYAKRDKSKKWIVGSRYSALCLGLAALFSAATFIQYRYVIMMVDLAT